MPQITVIVDAATEKYLRKGCETQGVSLSHYTNNLIQRAIILDNNTESIESLLKQPKFVSAFKKLLRFNTENLALMKYMVSQLGDENSKKSNMEMLDKAQAHAESYVNGFFEE